MITEEDLIKAQIEAAHLELFARFMEGRACLINEMWGRRQAMLHVKWGAVVLVLISIIVYLLIK